MKSWNGDAFLGRIEDGLAVLLWSLWADGCFTNFNP